MAWKGRKLGHPGGGAVGKVGWTGGNVKPLRLFGYDEISHQTFDSNEVCATHRRDGRERRGGLEAEPQPAETQGNNWVSDPLET